MFGYYLFHFYIIEHLIESPKQANKNLSEQTLNAAFAFASEEDRGFKG